MILMDSPIMQQVTYCLGISKGVYNNIMPWSTGNADKLQRKGSFIIGVSVYQKGMTAVRRHDSTTKLYCNIIMVWHGYDGGRRRRS